MCPAAQRSTSHKASGESVTQSHIYGEKVDFGAQKSSEFPKLARDVKPVEQSHMYADMRAYGVSNCVHGVHPMCAVCACILARYSHPISFRISANTLPPLIAPSGQPPKCGVERRSGLSVSLSFLVSIYSIVSVLNGK